MTKARLTESSFKRARTELKEKGYIKHTFINRNRAPLYEMISCINQVVPEEAAAGMDAGVSEGTNPGLSALFKRKERKRKENHPTAAVPNPHDFYEQNMGMLSPFIAERIAQWCEELSDELVIESIKRSLQQNKRFFKYCEAILKRWQSAGVTSLEEVDALSQEQRPKEKEEDEIEDMFEEIRKERNL